MEFRIKRHPEEVYVPQYKNTEGVWVNPKWDFIKKESYTLYKLLFAIKASDLDKRLVDISEDMLGFSDTKGIYFKHKLHAYAFLGAIKGVLVKDITEF